MDELVGKDNSRLPGLYVKTFGCQMNEYDSEKMIALLAKTYRLVETPEEAELALINTCSVREKAQHKLYSLLGSLCQLKSENPGLIVGVGGCVAQQDGEALLRRDLGVDFVVGTHNLSLIPALVSRAKEGAPASAAVDYREEWEELPEETTASGNFLSPDKDSRPVRALVAIQRGCDKRCSFCVVPGTRGPQVSRDAEEVLREIRLKSRLGAKEVLLLGQTVNSYGVDLKPRFSFEELLRQVAQVPGIERIRFTSPHPAEFRPSLLALYNELPQLCPHIHLPLQSGSNRILKLMRRNYRKERFLEIAELAKQYCPGIGITTDLIVGFPTETEDEFEETLEVMRKVRFSDSYSFKYSVRPNTSAERDYSENDLVSNEIALERLLKLQSLQTELTLEFNSRFIGKTVEVLVERRDKKISSAFRGRVPQNILVQIAGISENGTPGDTSSVEGSNVEGSNVEGSNVEGSNVQGGNLQPVEIGSTVRVEIKRVSPHALFGVLA